VQHTSKFERTICTTENRTESRSSITNAFHSVVEKRNLYLKIGADAGVAFVSAVQYIISIKDSEGSILVSTHAYTVNAVRRIKTKTKQILPTVLPT
jgi:hypothetical protein